MKLNQIVSFRIDNSWIMNCIEGPSETTFCRRPIILSGKKGYDPSTLETILLVRSHTNSIGQGPVPPWRAPGFFLDLLPDPLD
jgi:hypothetical protein